MHYAYFKCSDPLMGVNGKTKEMINRNKPFNKQGTKSHSQFTPYSHHSVYASHTHKHTKLGNEVSGLLICFTKAGLRWCLLNLITQEIRPEVWFINTLLIFPCESQNKLYVPVNIGWYISVITAPRITAITWILFVWLHNDWNLSPHCIQLTVNC